MEPSVKVKGVAGRPCAKCGYRIPDWSISTTECSEEMGARALPPIGS